jgi:predicted nucleotidyltransferase
MYDAAFVQRLVDRLNHVGGVKAVVLGGSYASGSQQPDSDIDLGLYYDEHAPLDIVHLRMIAQELNDFLDPVVTAPGEWGRWVNGGAWLTIEGQRVDFLYRSLDFVTEVIDACNRGEKLSDYYQQPPYGFHSYIYCAEIQQCQVLYDPEGVIPTLKSKVAIYPQPLKKTIINSFTWDAAFTLQNARKSAKRGDVYFVAGCITRIASDLVQTLYALNETYFISDKRFYRDVERFDIKPEHFAARIHRMLGNVGHDEQGLAETIRLAEGLVHDVIALCGDMYKAKY